LKKGVSDFNKMRSLFLISSLVCLNFSVAAQLKTNMGEGKLGSYKVNWDDQFIIVDKNGANFHSYYEGVDGHPFFSENFKSSTITLASGEVFKNVIARLDLYKQMLQIRLNGDTVKSILPGNVTEVIFYDTINSKPYSYKFQSGYPSIDNLSKNSFYQVLCEGNVELLKSNIKKINEQKNEMSGELRSQFDVYEDYYLYVKYEMKRLKKDKEFLLSMLSDKRKELEAYANDQKINFKSIDAIGKFIAYYNSL
jgi:hypothetical protein